MEDEENQRGRGERKRKRRLVLVTSPFQGHMTPILQLGTVLHSKGFSIAIAHCNLNSPHPSHHPADFIFLSLSHNLTAYDSSAGFTPFLEALRENCAPPLKQHLNQMIRENQPPMAIIYDNTMYFVEAVASDLNIPSIVLRSCSASYLPVYLSIPRLHQEGRFPVQDSMLQELVPEFYPLRYKDLPFINSPIDDVLQHHGISIQIKKPSAIIWNTVHCLEHLALSQIQHHYEVPIFSIGPLHALASSTSTSSLKEETSCIAWLDKQAPKSVIYVSLGSLATMDQKELAETAWGLANSNRPFLWAIRPGSVRGSEWIEFLPDSFKEEIRERGLILRWVPQRQVLAHVAVGGFWSHCGWNSTLESTSAGVPMICRPFLGDQGINSRNITYVWKVGIELECLERGVIARTITKLLVDKEGEEIRTRAKNLKENVIAAVHKGGSSYDSLNNLVEFILSS